MNIVCESCRQQGPSAGIWRRDDLIALECSQCGHLNRLDRPTTQPPTPTTNTPPTPPPAEQSPPQATPSPPPTPRPLTKTKRRCPRCAHDNPPPPTDAPERDACDRCGFAFSNYRPGQMPWELPPPGKEDAWAHAQTLWTARSASQTSDTQTADADDALLKFCIASGLEEWAARQYRLLLADHPDDPHASAQLNTLLSAAQTKLLSQLASERAHLDSNLARTRTYLLWGLVVLALILLGYYFAYSQF